jgi:hypothetical protein
MTYDDHHKMIDTPILATSNLGLIVLNFILGFAGNDFVNAAVAFTGLFITLLANVQRIVYGAVWFISVYRSGWKLPDKETIDNKPEKEQQ